MRFALVVPALNEEEAIADTLRRALAARAKVLDATPVDDMVVVFVNDGSTDRTQEIVDQPEFDEVVKVRFERNQGYGAAIKAGWQAVDTELVGFIDGDGTCDPDFCVHLINRLEKTNADVVLASRLNPDSRMPLIRKVGNTMFARLLGVISGKSLTDCASGFRVVRRSSLRLLSPLPDGMHFTPTLSAICLLDPRLRIEEVPMPYQERLGRSKLSVLKDGLRFLFTILFAACCYTPIKTMLAASAVTGAASLALVALLMLTGWAPGAGALIGLGGLVVAMQGVYTGIICHQLNFLLLGPRYRVGPAEQVLQQMLEYRRLLVVGPLIAAVGLVGLIGAGLWGTADYLTLVPLMFLVIIGGSTTLGGLIVRVIWAVGEKEKALLGGAAYRTDAARPLPPPARPRLAAADLLATAEPARAAVPVSAGTAE
jgi:hypothetical protein